MKIVKKQARVEARKCSGCGICRAVCPVLAVSIANRIAKVDTAHCLACANCEQRCPEHAIELVPREVPLTVGVDPNEFDQAEIGRICHEARLHPDQLICYCLRTRADEVAAAILQGARTPEQLSRATGVRTGCAVLCIQSMLRLLKGAGIAPERPAGFQWYGKPITLWDIPETVKRKYAGLGYHLDEDREIMGRIPAERGDE